MPSEPEFLTPKEAADRYRVSARTIIRLIASGVVPAVKVGRQWRIKRSDLDRAFSTDPTPPGGPRRRPTRGK